MKPNYLPISSCWLVLGLGISCLTLRAGGAQSKARPAPATATNTIAQLEIPQSVFTVPATTKEGRNPFFPYSKQPLPKVTSIKNTGYDPSLFVLNGITSPPKRTAIINNRTFEPGESGEVRLPSGAKVLIKCLEIRDDSAVIEVDGQRRELRLRFGL